MQCSFRSPSRMLQMGKLNKVNLNLACDSPRKKARNIIHNNPHPLHSSLEMIRKIERKRKQMDLINAMKHSNEFPCLHN
jgi:hypothetical protein